jgi:NADPH:quinone reductase-like Zn-dependent oxidoreductase
VKAIVQDAYGSTEVLALQDIDRPVIGPDDLLVRVAAAGVDRGVWHLMTGLPYLGRLAFGLRRPKDRVRGMDVAGRVEAVGANVTRFAEGDDVFGTCVGAFAEYAAAKADRFVMKPANLTYAEAAAVPVSAVTALQAVRDKGRVRPGQRVLIIGAGGGVGTFAVQLAKAFGAHVTGVCGSTKVDLVRSIGADDVVDYTHTDFATQAQRYDVILDIAGNATLSRLRRVLSPKGTLVIVGGEGGGRWLGGIDRQLRAVLLSPFVGQRLGSLLALPRTADLRVISELIEAGKVRPVVDRTYPLGETADAIRYLEQGHARGKVVISL